MKLDIKLSIDLNDDFYNHFDDKDILKKAMCKIIQEWVSERKDKVTNCETEAGDFYASL